MFLQVLGYGIHENIQPKYDLDMVSKIAVWWSARAFSEVTKKHLIKSYFFHIFFSKYEILGCENYRRHKFSL